MPLQNGLAGGGASGAGEDLDREGTRGRKVLTKRSDHQRIWLERMNAASRSGEPRQQKCVEADVGSDVGDLHAGPDARRQEGAIAAAHAPEPVHPQIEAAIEGRRVHPEPPHEHAPAPEGQAVDGGEDCAHDRCAYAVRANRATMLRPPNGGAEATMRAASVPTGRSVRSSSSS